MSTIDFVKGHCGWDVVTLVAGGGMPREDELEVALAILDEPISGGLEVGFIEAGPVANTLHLRMVSSTARDWIPMCGGMTQVIGKALIETHFRELFDIDAHAPHVEVDLLTAAGTIAIAIERGEAVTSTRSTMTHYIDHLYRGGIEATEIDGVPLLRVEAYAVIDVRDLERAHPQLEFTHRRFGPALDRVHALLKSFGDRYGHEGVTAMLYDDRPEGPGAYRVFPRFYSADLAAARVPWEFQCGTGSIAVAAALKHKRLLPQSDAFEILLEWGSQQATRDPYGLRTSMLTLTADSERLREASFRHSVTEILVEGRLTLPSFVVRG